MKEYFFTFGGGQFWEDLFVFHGWRIQRNLTSKEIRLLDNWDISRCEDSYDGCFKALEKYAEAYEIKFPESPHLVVMLHGFGQTRKIFSYLEAELNKKGLQTAAINYPSTQRGIKEQSDQINSLINNLRGISSISFITLGAGNIVMEKALADNPAWNKKIKVSEIIEINPLTPHDGLKEKLGNIAWLNFIFGPMIKDMSAENLTNIHKLPDINTGVIILKKSWIQKLCAILLRKHPLRQSDDEIKLNCGASEIVDLKIKESKALKSILLKNTILNFLTEKHF